jgi:hypothetical protein
MMAKSASDVIGLEFVKALREAGFVIVHSVPTREMLKAGYSVGRTYESLEKHWHRMVAESIRQQTEDGK